MWSKIWTWAMAHKVPAAAFAIALALVLGNALDGCDARSRAKGYFDLAKSWYERAQYLEKEGKRRDAAFEVENARLKAALKAARTGKPWRPPAHSNETAERFRRLGYDARIGK